MNILVTGAKGMVGTALCNNLKNIRDGKNKTRPALNIEEIFEYDLDSTPAELDEYCRTIRNICAIRHSCIIADGAVAANAGKVAHSRTSANDAVGVNQGVVPYRYITVDFRSGIQQDTVANGCTILDASVLQHHTTTSQLGVWTDVSTRCNDIGEPIAKGFRLLIHLRSELVVADAYHQQAILFPQLRQISKAANHRNTTDLSAYGLSIIHKGTVILEHRLLHHYAPKAAGTNQQQLFFRHSGCPSVHFGHIRWSESS